MILVPVAVRVAVGLSEVAVLVDEKDVAGATITLTSSGRESSASLGVLAVSVVVFLDVATLSSNSPKVEVGLAARNLKRGGGGSSTLLDERSGIKIVSFGVIGSVGPGIFNDFLGIVVLNVDALVKNA